MQNEYRVKNWLNGSTHVARVVCGFLTLFCNEPEIEFRLKQLTSLGPLTLVSRVATREAEWATWHTIKSLECNANGDD